MWFSFRQERLLLSAGTKETYDSCWFKTRYAPIGGLAEKITSIRSVELYLKEQQNWLAGISVAAKREYYLYFNNGNSRR